MQKSYIRTPLLHCTIRGATIPIGGCATRHNLKASTMDGDLHDSTRRTAPIRPASERRDVRGTHFRPIPVHHSMNTVTHRHSPGGDQGEQKTQEGNCASSQSLRHAIRINLIRSLDIFIALTLFVLTLPLMILIGIFVFISDPGPILFAHKRVGYQGKHFYCLKFRTMARDAEQRLHDLLLNNPELRDEWNLNQKLEHDPRVYRGGNFLRMSSFDELPQLFNVLRGDMSFVGPRPIVENEIPRYGHYFSTYCGVKPGLTGLWQVSGRNNTSYRQRVAMDVHYCRNRSLRLNVKLLVLTIPSILMAKGSR